MTRKTRRVVLGALGSMVSLGTLAEASREPPETLSVRVWLSEQAATYEGVTDRIREYLTAIRSLEHWTVELSFGGTVAVSTEDAARLMTRGEWPTAVVAGGLGRRDLDPVADVNLLVTDGRMEDAPTGYGVAHIASVGGARHIADLEPFDESLVDGTRWIVPNTAPTRTMQVLVHEIGHALGLDHEHGVAIRDGEAVIATPMLSSYAWDPSYQADHDRCGSAIPPAQDGLEKRLSFAFSPCARRELATYDGGLFSEPIRTDRDPIRIG
ncbi:peptidase M10A and M12B matrixin and adamalysin [Natrinema pallidum]|uniref:Peptidase M10A and M12B matrixin and adamalysin n=1 Tax=Natrinema pallidum TaxID=69527 RepID=A0A4P9TD78_9EURY|nr:peptidase M10A and M12B matrixin and adamalysin [Natrinema pallidum]QCW02547.1 peptidase M10A and M12B matrixin and adamalysin [Natrinema pallidum]